ncbi:hypothetical protein DP939_39640 [Spongiactinospora rosea]|uniref:Uncharacterized protein n=1 Tax=Spongiactinospora rosea TaxID=2248750 RepID=A0A366LMQ7_9ACTN|nr:hypothetical protein [Spongiactinospora rosea]RBQ14719.1 hypothetical protein DP939_39640 [Spongiactinospora rosea]
MQLEQVQEIQRQGAFVVAGLDAFARNPWRAISSRDRSAFSDLGRALLINSVVSHRDDIKVITRFDEDTPLYRRLRVEELQEEIATARTELSSWKMNSPNATNRRLTSRAGGAMEVHSTKPVTRGQVAEVPS